MTTQAVRSAPKDCSGPAFFGEVAQAWAPDFPAGLSAVIFDPSGIPAAYQEMVRRRKRAQPFYCGILLDDSRADVARKLAPQMLAQFSDYDQRRCAFDLLATSSLNVNGEPVAALHRPDVHIIERLRDLLTLGDGLLVRSWTEHDRIVGFTQRKRALVGLAPKPAAIPAWSGTTAGSAIVVWAPDAPACDTAMIAFALEQLRVPVVVLCAGGATVPGLRAQYAGLSDAARVLAGAACIVDASTSDPGPALALARGGVPLAVAATSGAHEFLAGVEVYEPWSWRSIHSAVLRALGGGAPRPRAAPFEAAELQRALYMSVPVFTADAPLASIVIPTFNRRAELPVALESLEGQTYQNFEAVVVNDGGEPVDDIVARFPRARLITFEHNQGMIRALNAGTAAARGKYVGALADDDRLYPDHVARTVHALERTGCAVANTNIMIRFTKRNANGAVVTRGFSSAVFAFHLDPTEALLSSPVAAQALMMRRDLLEQVGLWDETLVLADQEAQIRLVKQHDFIHVDNVTGEWVVREGDDFQYTARKEKDVPAELQKMFDLHPVGNRPVLEAHRQSTIASVKARPPGYRFPPMIEFPA